MTKAELLSLVDAVLSVWPSEQIDRKALYKTWWRYLADIEFTKAEEALDAYVLRCVDPEANQGALRGSWRPTPGDIRRLAIDGTVRSWPTADEAWAAAEQRINALQSGVQAPVHPDPEVDETIGATLRTSKASRLAFLSAWRTNTIERGIMRYRLPDDAPSIHTE